MFVDDVPRYGPEGVRIEGSSENVEVRVPLSAGDNEVEVSCRDRTGNESFRVPFIAHGGKETTGDLWFLGFGVSRYRDTRLDLAFTHKDAQDLERSFRAMERTARFAAVHTRIRSTSR